MKTRRIWIVIVVILIAGVCSTTYTKRYVEERESSASMRRMTEAAYDAAGDTAGTMAEAAMAGAPETAAYDSAAAAPDGARAAQRAAVPGSADRSTAPNASGQAEETAAAVMETSLPAKEPEEGAAAAPASLDSEGGAAGEPISEDLQAEADSLTAEQKVAVPAGTPQADAANAPLPGTESAVAEPVPENQTDVIIAGSGKEKAEISYKTRLEELDAQIERNRKADAEKSVANSAKVRAENELKLWEAELDGIIKALAERLEPAQVEALYTKQREWRREKETKALEDGKRQGGSALEEVGYSVSLAESTRARAYELVDEYEAVLGE